MARLTWDNQSERFFETGIRQGILFLKNDNGTYSTGIPWNGLISVSEKFTGADPIHVYATDVPFLDIYELEEFGITIEAYTYPEEFEQCEGLYSVPNTPISVAFQDRKRFALCYKTMIGNDTEGSEHACKIHIVYDCVVNPSDREYETFNASPELVTFSWDASTYAVNCSDYKQSPILILDSRKYPINKIESYLYGTKTRDSYLPSFSEIVEYCSTHYLVTEDYDAILFGTTRILV